MSKGCTNNAIVKATTSTVKCLSYSPKSIGIDRNSGKTRSNRIDKVFKLKRTIYCIIWGGGLIRYLMGTYWCAKKNASRRIITYAKRDSIFKKNKSRNVWVTDTCKWNYRLKISPQAFCYQIGPG